MKRWPPILACLMALLPWPTLCADELAEKVYLIFQKRCYRCHGSDKKAERLLVLDHKVLTESAGDETYVVPGSTRQSYVWFRVAVEKDMPPKDPLPEDEILELKAWIESGAPAWEVPEERTPISEQAALEAIANHLFNKVPKPRQRHTRYFSITHLFNNPKISNRDLRVYRAALSKAVNSLSRAGSIIVPTPVNEQQTIFAIDLAALGWEDSLVWEQVTSRYPYGLTPRESGELDAFEKIKEIYGTFSFDGFAYMRADWFIVTATRPPIYHTLLNIPATLDELYKKQGIDPVRNFVNGTAKRAGLFESGVSAQNRLIEYHDGGSFWISYDFKQHAGRSSLAQFPLGPRFTGNKFDQFAFQQDGGEIIFQLPNDLHGYMLVDGAGKQISAGPVEVVYDDKKTSGSPLIVTGVSCIACHQRGLNPLEDNILNGHARGGNAEAQQKIRELFPPKPEMDTVISRVNVRYLNALKDAISVYYPPETNFEEILNRQEPISFVSEKYFENVDLTTAARELGFTVDDQLKQKLGGKRLEELGLAPLLQGSIKRGFWESASTGVSVFQQAAIETSRGSAKGPSN